MSFRFPLRLQKVFCLLQLTNQLFDFCDRCGSPRLDVKGHAAARPQRDTCDRVRPMPGDRSETKGVNQNCQNDSRLDHRETGADADARPRAER